MDINNILAAAGLSLEEKFSISLTTLLTGFVVVFLVLILLIVVISVYGKIVYSAQNKSKEKANEVKAEAPKAVASVNTAPIKSSASGISDEIIAVIAAAVDSTYGAGNAKIKTIQKSSPISGRPVWSQAGVLDNTRPF